MSKTLIVGGGLTGSATAYLLRQERKDGEIFIWEKENELGGRICTSRCDKRRDCIADLGLPFILLSLENLKHHARFYDMLIKNDKIIKCPSTIEGIKKVHGTPFVATNGLGSVVKYICEVAGAKVSLNREVKCISLKDNRWFVTDINEKSDVFDIVIITIPVPLVLKLEGNFKEAISEKMVKDLLEGVTYANLHSMALYYYTPVEAINNIPWSAKSCKDDDTIRLISIDNKKRGSPNSLPAVVLQATVNFSEKHDTDNKTEHEAIMFRLQKKLRDILPDLPEADNVALKCWKYGKTIKPFPDYIGCLILKTDPLLILGGDGFTQSTFQGCLDSSERIVEEVIREALTR